VNCVINGKKTITLGWYSLSKKNNDNLGVTFDIDENGMLEVTSGGKTLKDNYDRTKVNVNKCKQN
jgi:hypothetical protein